MRRYSRCSSQFFVLVVASCATIILAAPVVSCDSGAAGEGDITGITAGDGLTGGGEEGDVTLGADLGEVQSRVTGTCTDDTAIQAIDEAGDVTCSHAFAPTDHNHDTDYAAAAHSHDADYAATDHNHDADYAAVAHNHDTDYVRKDEFNGVASNNCTANMGFIIIGNTQAEFGCADTCDTICGRHGLTCEREYSISGTMHACSSVSNSRISYCWCKS